MFDDQPVVGSNPPSNLPTEDPADMFGDMDKGASDNAENLISSQPSALDKGILKPKTSSGLSPNYTVPPDTNTPAPQNGGMPEVYTVKEPTLTRNIMTILAILVLGGVLGGGGWWIYNKFVKTGTDLTNLSNTTEEITPEVVENNQTNTDLPVENLPEIVEDNNLVSSTDNAGVVNDLADSQVLFGEPVDKDTDGLDDAKEVELKTDPNNWDSDNDELSDGDEVLVWKTDPLNPDTDNDKYKDGMEVKNGYNPSGPGKIFEPPKEENK